jgi:hypothetical protein
MNAHETWVALVHHPVYDKHRRVVATALTNLDLHDIARSTRTYGLAGFLIVHPVEAQRELAERIAGHWLEEGAQRNDFRRQAIERVAVVATLDDARAHVAARAGRPPIAIATAARPAPDTIGYRAIHRELADGPALIVLGTGWGLTDEVLASCERRLAPVQAGSDYNHLSVRSACAIILDRLYGDREDYAP